jgi:putative ATPase
VASADGDGRFLLGQAETLYNAQIASPLDPSELGQFLQRRVAVYDKDRDGHYNLISALHKSVRGSDPQAALYYLARMLTAGEDPMYLLRRLVRMASEDIGLADPMALQQCLAAKDAFEFLGSPEANWPSRRPASIWPARPNRTRPIRDGKRPPPAPRPPDR